MLLPTSFLSCEFVCPKDCYGRLDSSGHVPEDRGKNHDIIQILFAMPSCGTSKTLSFARLLVGSIPVREKPLMLFVCFAHLARESAEIEHDTAEFVAAKFIHWSHLCSGGISAMVVLYYQTATLKWHSRH